MKDIPCVQCGFCCTLGPCEVAIKKYGNDWKSPCPSLRPAEGGRQLCGEIIDHGEYLGIFMGHIGSGCSSSLFNEMRDNILRKKVKT